MITMNILLNHLCEIRTYCLDLREFLVGKILLDSDERIFLIEYDSCGSYDGITVLDKNLIYKIKYKSKYLDFINKIYTEHKMEYNLINFDNFIRYCIDNNRLLNISCKKWNCFRNCKILSYTEGLLKCQIINKLGEPKSVKHILSENIDYLEYDTNQLKTYERFIYSNQTQK